jgi:hypothetical protein
MMGRRLLATAVVLCSALSLASLAGCSSTTGPQSGSGGGSGQANGSEQGKGPKVGSVEVARQSLAYCSSPATDITKTSVSFIGPGPVSGGNPSSIYRINDQFNLTVFDLGAEWDIAPSEFANDPWSCGWPMGFPKGQPPRVSASGGQSNQGSVDNPDPADSEFEEQEQPSAPIDPDNVAFIGQESLQRFLDQVCSPSSLLYRGVIEYSIDGDTISYTMHSHDIEDYYISTSYSELESAVAAGTYQYNFWAPSSRDQEIWISSGCDIGL